MVRRTDPPDITPGALGRANAAGTLEALFHDAQLALEDGERDAFLLSVSRSHDSGEIDLVACASRSAGPIDYMAGQVYERTIPSLEMDVGCFVALAIAMAARSKDGTMPFFMFDATSAWARQDRRRVTGLLDAIADGSAPDSLRIATLQAGLLAERTEFLEVVTDMLVRGDGDQSRDAGFVIGTLTPADAAEGVQVANAIEAALGSDDADRQAASFDAALTMGLREGGDEAVASSALATVAGGGSPRLRQIAAKALFLARGGVSDELLQSLCGFMGEVQAGEAEAIEMINNALAQRLKVRGPCRHLLDDMLRREVADLKAMDDCAYHILQVNDGSLELILADWVADGADGLIAAVRDIVQIPASQRDITLDLDFTAHALTAGQTLSSGRKVVASLVLHPETAASILLSLMRTGHSEAGDGLEAVLFDPLLLSYWEGPREYLDAVMKDQPEGVRSRIERVVVRLDEYTGAIISTGVIRELGPSERQRFLNQIGRLEERRRMQEEMPRRSVLADLFPVTNVLYGDSVVSDVYSGDGPPTRQEFKMGTVSHSIPLARLDAIDPFGFWYQRIVLSLGKAP